MRLDLGEPGAGRVGGRLAHLLHRRDHFLRVGDHLVPKDAAHAGVKLLNVGSKPLRPPPRLEALLRGPQIPQLLRLCSIRALDDDVRAGALLLDGHGFSFVAFMRERNQRSLTRSVWSQRDISERITRSPSRNPSRTSTAS